ncbi:MAG: hypothetical protein IJI58_05370 [Bacilli bacterium]|nr:hypothetical protein [Bacilli bacterium]
MKKLNEKNKQLITIGIVLLCIILLCAGYWMYRMFFVQPEGQQDDSNIGVTEVTDYNVNIIKEINKEATDNYLISPYSIEMALSMLKEGADGTTREEIEDLIGDRDINILKIPKKVNVANGVFINQDYKDSVLSSYSDIVKDKYKSELIYDKFQTPDVINKWVNRETYQMIPTLFKELPKDTLMVLVNALAIDVEWNDGFDCKRTTKYSFSKQDGKKMDVAMMYQSYEKGTKYFELDDAQGVILPYASYDSNGNKVEKNGNNLEFIGILPDDDVKDYVDNLTVDKIKEIDEEAKVASEGKKLALHLPKFEYDYEIDGFVEKLKELGIKEVFTPSADLSKMIDEPAHVSSVVHKTYIELKEEGTKAAAATGVIVEKNTASEDEIVHIAFDKPFAYIIRDQKTKEMLFFGVVYEPNKWTGKSCK